MMIRAALCYSLQPTFGQLQLSESLTKTFWYKYCPPWFKAVESYKSGPGKSQPLPFSPWPAHMKMAFLPLGLKTFYLKQLLFPWLLRRCEILFFLFECVWFCGGLVFTPRCILNLFLCCVRVVCVCVLCMYMHTHTQVFRWLLKLYVLVHIWRSEDNIGCWSLPSTLIEGGSPIDLHCIYKSRFSFRGSSYFRLPSCCRSTRIADTCYYVYYMGSLGSLPRDVSPGPPLNLLYPSQSFMVNLDFTFLTPKIPLSKQY